MAKRKEDKITGKISMDQFRTTLNKKAGFTRVFNLAEDDPTTVNEWISTGSTLLDCITVRGKRGGIPVGRITEISGLESCVTEDTLIDVVVDDED